MSKFKEYLESVDLNNNYKESVKWSVSPEEVKEYEDDNILYVIKEDIMKSIDAKLYSKKEQLRKQYVQEFNSALDQFIKDYGDVLKEEKIKPEEAAENIREKFIDDAKSDILFYDKHDEKDLLGSYLMAVIN